LDQPLGGGEVEPQALTSRGQGCASQ
jgi:hypothetical protein